eukprot:2514086-Rhodomonas_salina.2
MQATATGLGGRLVSIALSQEREACRRQKVQSQRITPNSNIRNHIPGTNCPEIAVSCARFRGRVQYWPSHTMCVGREHNLAIKRPPGSSRGPEHRAPSYLVGASLRQYRTSPSNAVGL